MSEERLKLVPATTAAEAARGAGLGDEASAILDPKVGVRGALARLAEAALWPDALRLLAHALPKREAVWWACRCARLAAGPPPAGPAAEALASAERWASDPSEAHRRSAEAAALAAGPSTPFGLAAFAAFWSGGSLAPAQFQAVPPGEHLTARAVSGATILSGILGGAAGAPGRYRKLLDLGLAVADGSDRPPSSGPAPAPAAPAPRRPSTKVPDVWD